MARRVAVELVLEAAKYLFGVRNVAAETKAAAEAVHGLDNRVDAAGRSLDEFAVSIIAGKKELEGFGDHAKEAGWDLELLDQRIDATKRKVALLGLEFAATGNAVAGKKFGDQRSLLTELENLRGELEGRNQSGPLADVLALIGGGKAKAPVLAAGKGFAATFAEGFSGGLKGPLIVGAIGAALAIAPGVAAVIAGAVTGVVGIGGVAGGLFAASKDQRVRAAASDLGHHLSEVFFASGDSFVGPIQQSVAFLKHDIDSLDLKSTFALASPFVTEFAHGLSGIVSEFLPGFNQALAKGKPAIDLFASRLPELGKDIGDMLSKLAGSEGTLEGVNALFNVVSVTIHFLGTSIAWLGDRFHDFNHDADATFSWLSKVTGWIGDDTDSRALKDTADDFKRLSDGAEQGAIHFATYSGAAQYATAITAQMGRTTSDTTDYVKEFRDAMIASQNAIDDWITNALGMADANTAVAQDFADLNDKLIKGKKNWDDNTQAGRDNGTEIRHVIRDLEAQRQQAIATSDGSQAAIDAINRKFDDLLGQLEKAAIKAGDTKAAFEAMAGTYHITIITDILTAATAAKASKTDKSLAKKGFASGGDPDPGDWAWVGEQGPELVKFGSQAHVYPTSQSSAMWGSAPAGSGAPIVVNNEITLMDPMTGQRTRAILITEATSRGVPQDVAKASYP